MERVIIFMKKTIFIILIIIISIFVYVTVNAEVIIPNDAIRVRVVPNSNSTVDQNMKEKVKDYVSQYLSLKLNGVIDVDEARKIINDNIDIMNKDIEKIFKDNNYKMNFKINNTVSTYISTLIFFFLALPVTRLMIV